MPQHKVKLVKNAANLAVERDAGVPSLIERISASNMIEVTGREYHRLQALGLVEAAELTNPAADQPEAEAAQAQAKQDLMGMHAAMRRGTGDNEHDPAKVTGNPGGTLGSSRGPSGTDSKIHPGGVGHQPGDGYGPSRIQGEITMDQFRGAFARVLAGQSPVKEQELAHRPAGQPAQSEDKVRFSNRRGRKS